jgi:hypothetical protein
MRAHDRLAIGLVLTAALASVAGVLARPAATAEATVLAEEIFDTTARPLGPITFLGDSVALGSLIYSPTVVDHLAAQGWGPIRAQAGVGTHTRDSGGAVTARGPHWIRQWRSEGWDPADVVIHLGANDSGVCDTNLQCARDSIQRMIDVVGPGHRIWWPLITRHPAMEHQAATWNEALRQIDAERDDFFTWDWPAVLAAAGFNSPDNTHLDPSGYRARSALMAYEITADLARGVRTGGPAALPAAAGVPSEFVPVATERVLDTRTTSGPVPAEQSIEVDVSGAVPAGATAAAVYVSATDTQGPGYVTAYSCGQPRPTASAANYAAGDTRGAVAIVPLTDGRFCLFTKATANLLADVQGAFVAASEGHAEGARLQPLATPQRLADTRTAGRTQTLAVAVPAGAAGVAVNLTVVGGSAAGFLTVYPCDFKRPLAAAVNHAPGEVVAGSAFVPVGPLGSICVYTKATDADIVVDLTATLATDAGLVFTPVAPTRTIDTRNGTGGWSPVHGQLQTIDARVAPPGAQAVTGTLTIVAPHRAGFLRAWGCGEQPGTSNVNAPAGATFANLVTTGVDPSGGLCVMSRSLTATVFDTTGWWTSE